MKINSRLDIDAHVITQLGEELITDAEQALLELVKNSYDADSSWCSVEVDTDYISSTTPGEKKGKLLGKITVSDDGCGMDRTAIDKGWLTISLSLKREAKLKGKATKKYNRTPIGDKGLGRLGTMKLGRVLKIITYHHPKEEGHEVLFSWEEFKSGTPLGDIDIQAKTVPASGKTGSIVEVIGLNDLGFWEGSKRIDTLRGKLSTLISPFKKFANFTIAFNFNNKPVELISFQEGLSKIATSSFDFTWDGSTLTLSGGIKLQIFKTAQKKEEFEELVLSNSGKNLYEFLKNHKMNSKINITKSKSKDWFIRIFREI